MHRFVTTDDFEVGEELSEQVGLDHFGRRGALSIKQNLLSRIQELEKIQGEVESAQGKNKEVNAEIMKKMVKTYETMAPKKAAGVLSVMKDDLAVEVLLKMKEKKLASILDAMEPNRAMTLSSIMAKRRPAGIAIGEEGAAEPETETKETEPKQTEAR